jgi:Domain of unknown function (DUF5063)
MADPVTAFAAMAEDYCALIESAESTDRSLLLGELASSLSSLYAAALELPNVQTRTDELLSEGLTHEQWEALYDQLEALFGDYAAYRTAGPLPEEEAQLYESTVSDDLADIYRDLKGGLLALSAGAPRNEVLWEWRFGFWTHWGSHTVEALRVIHARLAERGGPE